MKISYVCILMVLIVGLIGVVGIGCVSAGDTGDTVQLGNVSVFIPSIYQNGEVSNYSDAGIYEKIVGGHVFRVTVHNGSEYFVSMAGYDMVGSSCVSQERVNVGGHPCLVCHCENNYQGNYTCVLFESNGSMVRVYIPNSHNLTNDGEALISSTPASLYDSGSFYDSLNDTVDAYNHKQDMEDMMEEAYDDGYYDGYDYSDETWYRNIPIIGSYMSN
jgi:hypothetical protein